MKKISKFDLGFIIAFGVLALIAAGVWWYMSGLLTTAQQDVSSAKSDFDKYSVKAGIVVSKNNGKILTANNALITAQLNPLLLTKLMSKGNKLSMQKMEDPVAWKHDLDDEVRRLTSAAKLHGVTIPPNFYFGFSRYLNINPGDDQTTVLSKQLLGVEQIANTLINSSVKSITSLKRTYEEDPRSGPGGLTLPTGSEADHLPGSSFTAPNNAYVSYPFLIEFQGTSETLRPVFDSLMNSPYVMVIRGVAIQDSSPESPQLGVLDSMAAAPGGTVENAPGDAGSNAPPTKGPQYLFGSSLLKIKMRVDMIEWTGGLVEAAPAVGETSGRKPGTPGR